MNKQTDMKKSNSYVENFDRNNKKKLFSMCDLYVKKASHNWNLGDSQLQNSHFYSDVTAYMWHYFHMYKFIFSYV